MADLTQLHGYRDSVQWRLTSNGVEISGGGVERTPGPPQTVTGVWESHAAAINDAATAYAVPCALIVATICTESAGRADAVRHEPGFRSASETPGKISVGLMQTLVSTAREALGDSTIDEAWLKVAANSIKAGTAFIARQKEETKLDPPLVAAAYNAGSLRHESSVGNRWKLVMYPVGTSEHVDRFVKWFNDAVAVLATAATKPAIGLDVLLGAAPAAKSFAVADGGQVARRFPEAAVDEGVAVTVRPVAVSASFAADTRGDARGQVARRYPEAAVDEAVAITVAPVASAAQALAAAVPEGARQIARRFPPEAGLDEAVTVTVRAAPPVPT
jgi:hypothetical protein